MSNYPPMPATPPNEPQGPYNNPNQPYPGPYNNPNQPYPGQNYPNQPYPGQNYPNQPYPGNYPQMPSHPGDRPNQTTMLVWSIITTLLCCPPLGIAAIIQSLKVDSAWNEGRFEDSRSAFKKAKNFVIASVSIGVVAVIFQIVVTVLTADMS